MRRQVRSTSRAAGAIALLTALVLAAPLAVAQKSPPDAGRVATARELLEVTGTAKTFETIMPAMMAQITRIMTTQRPEKRAEIEEVAKVGLTQLLARRQELIDQIAVLYAKRFSDEDLAGLITFYKSPVGRRFVAEQPELLKESMATGQAWGQRIGAEIDASMRKELKKRGIDL